MPDELGANLALAELKYIIGSVFRHFTAVPPDGCEDKELALADVFAAGSRTGHCWLRFQQLDG